MATKYAKKGPIAGSGLVHTGRKELAERLKAEIHIDEAHGFPPGFNAETLADYILGEDYVFWPRDLIEDMARSLVSRTVLEAINKPKVVKVQ